MAKRVVSFAAADGQLFGSAKEADNHDAELLTHEKIKGVLSVSLSTMRAASVVNQIMLAADELLPILVAHSKRAKKVK